MCDTMPALPHGAMLQRAGAFLYNVAAANADDQFDANQGGLLPAGVKLSHQHQPSKQLAVRHQVQQLDAARHFYASSFMTSMRRGLDELIQDACNDEDEEDEEVEEDNDFDDGQVGYSLEDDDDDNQQQDDNDDDRSGVTQELSGNGKVPCWQMQQFEWETRHFQQFAGSRQQQQQHMYNQRFDFGVDATMQPEQDQYEEEELIFQLDL